MCTAKVGTILHGYCGGAFGCLDFEPKRIEAIGADWVVIRSAKGRPYFCSFDKPAYLDTHLEDWLQDEEFDA